ncbi:purine catabolism regulator [Streptosporangium becharense]|uniref:Purine catabolism regulator n=1 Tax=Streptosporangium becharense TaxID=1816182 RepID=A0A7W9IF04_9ACTN|nr:PucR family transcriptional regulator [Streptosporangium becharense]MBB2915570.1 purine catabolism regulator [Streptosporangium becharense]MBB5818903.1 purine catabolism regulator [Streptosporangium becharense]
MTVVPTLRTVVRRLPFQLVVLAGQDAMDRPVRWVAVSELEDPTPFLEGGELVLTTGMRLDAAGAAPYVDRLVGRGVTGLGFGVGLGHDRTPDELVEAAARAGLPLVEVARDTPFVAIGKAVSDLIAAEQYDELSRAFTAQGRLTRAALRPEGPPAVIERLAREITGWAVLLDDAGVIRHAAGEGAPEAATRALGPELERLRRLAARGAPASLALSTPQEHVIVQPLGAGRVRGFLAVGRDRPFTPVAHTVVNAAGSLLTLAAEHGGRHLAAEGRVRSAVLRLLLEGRVRAGRETLERLGERLADGPLVAIVSGVPEEEREAVLEAAGEEFAAVEGDRVVLLVPEDRVDGVLVRLDGHGPVGVGSPAGPEDLRAGLDQADRALAAARRAAAPVMRFADLAGQGLLSLLDPGAAAAYSVALLAPLRQYGPRADLLASLRAYLSCNGHWDAAAQRLGVHRHTLRYRMRRVAELLGRDLDDPAVRAELWVALAVAG